MTTVPPEVPPPAVAPTGTADPPRRSRPALVTALAVGVVLALLVAVLATRDPAVVRLVKSPLVGKVAPAVTAPVIGGSQTFSLDAQRGRWVVVNFFATWCVPCQEEHDDLARFAAAHDAAGDARVVSVVFADSASDVQRYFSQRGGSWPVLRDDDGALATAWGVAKVPESYLVAPNGVVVGKVTGGVTFDFLEAQLAAFRSDGS